MKYEGITMFPSERTDIRLSLVKDGSNVLIVIGFNPSTADDSKPDRTMESVMRIAEYNGYDGFVMLNIYPLRSTSPKNLPKEIDLNIHNRNIEHIIDILGKYPSSDVLLAYGNLIKERQYSKFCVNEILKILKAKHRSIYCITKLASGNPRHPLYAKGTSLLQKFVD
jgi:hypothetical protein